MSVVADTGALYALIDQSDSWHAKVTAWWRGNRKPIFVPVTVLPEVTYLLQTRISTLAEVAFVRAIADEEFVVEPLDGADVTRADALMRRYLDLPLGFVDATVVAIAERLGADEILTTDRRHFGVVRGTRSRPVILVP